MLRAFSIVFAALISFVDAAKAAEIDTKCFVDRNGVAKPVEISLGEAKNNKFDFAGSSIFFQEHRPYLTIIPHQPGTPDSYISWTAKNTIELKLNDIRDAFQSLVYRNFVQPLNYSKFHQKQEEPFGIRLAHGPEGAQSNYIQIDFVITVRPDIPIINTRSGATIRMPFAVYLKPVLSARSVGFEISVEPGEATVERSALLSLLRPLERLFTGGRDLKDLVGEFAGIDITAQLAEINSKFSSLVNLDQAVEGLLETQAEPLRSAIRQYTSEWRILSFAMVKDDFADYFKIHVVSGVLGNPRPSETSINHPETACNVFRALLPANYTFGQSYRLTKLAKPKERDSWRFFRRSPIIGSSDIEQCVIEEKTSEFLRTYTNKYFVDWISARRKHGATYAHLRRCLFRDSLYQIEIEGAGTQIWNRGKILQTRPPGTQTPELSQTANVSFSSTLANERITCREPKEADWELGEPLHSRDFGQQIKDIGELTSKDWTVVVRSRSNDRKTADEQRFGVDLFKTRIRIQNGRRLVFENPRYTQRCSTEQQCPIERPQMPLSEIRFWNGYLVSPIAIDGTWQRYWLVLKPTYRGDKQERILGSVLVSELQGHSVCDSTLGSPLDKCWDENCERERLKRAGQRAAEDALRDIGRSSSDNLCGPRDLCIDPELR